jgi:hypothetical protein
MSILLFHAIANWLWLLPDLLHLLDWLLGTDKASANNPDARTASSHSTQRYH